MIKRFKCKKILWILKAFFWGCFGTLFSTNKNFVKLNIRILIYYFKSGSSGCFDCLKSNIPWWLIRLGFPSNLIYKVCLFAHLLCVHTVFKQNFVIPFFLLTSFLHCLDPSPKYQSEMTNPSFLNMHWWRHPGRAKMLCMLLKRYTSILLGKRKKPSKKQKKGRHTQKRESKKVIFTSFEWKRVHRCWENFFIFV